MNYQCSECSNFYEKKGFYFGKNLRIQMPCKKCRKERSKKRYMEKREEILKKNRESQEVKDYQKKYWEENKERIKEKKYEQNRKYKERNRKYLNEKSKEYHYEHREFLNQKRRERQEKNNFKNTMLIKNYFESLYWSQS